MAKVVVTGAAGFIGSALTDRILAEGHDVVGVDNLWRGKSENITHLRSHSRFRFLDADICDTSPSWDDAFDDAELVFHYAAINGTRHFYERPLEVLQVNLEGTVNMLRYAAKHEIGKFVFASSSEVYGDAMRFPTPEDHPILLPDTSNPRYSYAATKAMGEFYVTWMAKQHGFDHLILRIFNTYGPRMDTSSYGQVIPEFIRKLLREPSFTIIGNPQHTRSFCYIDDHVEMTWQAVRRASNDTINLGSEEEVTIRRLAELIHEIEGRAFSYEQLPPRQGDCQRRVPDTTKIRRLTGFTPRVGLREGLEQTIAWYKGAWRST